MSLQKDFERIVADAISKLKNESDYQPGKEVVVLVLMNGKYAKRDSIPLDNTRIKYVDGKDFGVELVCKITGNIR